MTGLDNILKQITEEADSVAQQKIKAARAQAESIREEGRQQAQRQKKPYWTRLRQTVKTIVGKYIPGQSSERETHFWKQDRKSYPL